MSNKDLYTNYEDAQCLANSKDLFVVRLVSAIHRSMLENANFSIQPNYPFDMRYFYSALVRSIASDFKHQVSDLDSIHSPPLITNFPNFSDAVWENLYFVDCGMADRFTLLIQNESSCNGTHFDINFACRIAAIALNPTTLKYIKEGIGVKQNPMKDVPDLW